MVGFLREGKNNIQGKQTSARHYTGQVDRDFLAEAVL